MPDLPIALAKWYDYVKWVLDRVDGSAAASCGACVLFCSAPVLWRFSGGARPQFQPRSACTHPPKAAQQRRTTKRRRGASLARLFRHLLSAAQFAFSARAVEECGRMVGGWLKQATK